MAFISLRISVKCYSSQAVSPLWRGSGCGYKPLAPPLKSYRCFISIGRMEIVRGPRISSLLFCLGVSLAVGCSEEAPPPGRILVKNDSQDREFNVISVLGGGGYAILKPGERFVLPEGTRTFTAQRKYKEYTRRYTVACPPLGSNGITVKMIDMHTNRMPAGCKTVSASKQ